MLKSAREDMTKVRCSQCGKEHDLGGVEPSFSRPDAFFEVPLEERERRINHSDEGCLISSKDGQELACFFRTVLRVPVKGERGSISWGLWVEVSSEAYVRVCDLSKDSDQAAEPPFPCTVANDIPNYPSTRGLPGTMRLTSPTTRPSLVVVSESTHPFAIEASAGVHFERSLEWRAWFAHR